MDGVSLARLAVDDDLEIAMVGVDLIGRAQIAGLSRRRAERLFILVLGVTRVLNQSRIHEGDFPDVGEQVEPTSGSSFEDEDFE